MTASFIPSILDELDDVQIASPASGRVIRHDGTRWVDAVLAHSDLSGIGTNSHAQIDTHLSSTSNPHGTTLTQTNLTVNGAFTVNNDIVQSGGYVIKNANSDLYLQTDTPGKDIIFRAGGVVERARITATGFDISNTAPAITLTDTTASAKSLKIDVDANIAQIREKAGAVNSLLSFDLANNHIGIFSAPGTFPYVNLSLTTSGADAADTVLQVQQAFSGNYPARNLSTIYGSPSITGSGSVATLKALSYFPYLINSANCVTVNGVDIGTGNYGSGTLTNAHLINIQNPAGSGTITNAIGVRIARQTRGGSRNYGLYYGTAAIGSEPSGNYAVYADSDDSYFGAKVGMGVTPTAVLHLKAGTASANTAPLKLTAGTNLTTPEAGAIEWDGTNLYVTQSGGTRKTVQLV